MKIPILTLKETHDRLDELLQLPQDEYLIVCVDPDQKIQTIKRTIHQRLTIQEKMVDVGIIVNIGAMNMKRIELIGKEISRTLRTFTRDIRCDIFTLPSSTFIQVREILETAIEKARQQK